MNRIALIALYPLLLLGLLFTACRYLCAVVGSPPKALNIAIMIDETCNVDANGRVNETISARAAKARNRKRAWGCLLCWALDKIQAHHCDKALADDVTGQG